MAERLFVRIIVAVAICIALLTSALVPVPVELPSPAFEQAGLYRLEVALMFFYGTLLLVTPAFSAVYRGRLPIEISTRGAKFAAEADGSAAQNEAAIKQLEGISQRMAQGLKDAQIQIESLKELVGSDSTQPEVDSEA
jgi:hypothetical protein